MINTQAVRPGSRGIIIHDNRLLVIFRQKFDREYYVLPGGGIESKETSVEAVAREVKEETSIQIKPQELIYELINDNGEKHDFWLCEYLGGDPSLRGRQY